MFVFVKEDIDIFVLVFKRYLFRKELFMNRIRMVKVI